MDVYLYCSNIKMQKEVKEGIEREVGVRVKRVLSSVKQIKKEYGIGVFVDDVDLSADFGFSQMDVVIVIDEIDFTKWLMYKKAGVEVFRYDYSFYELVKHFLKLGVSLEKCGGADLEKEICSKGDKIREVFSGEEKELITFYSVKEGVGKSSIVYEWGKILGEQGKNALILDLDRNYSYIGYLVKKGQEFYKLDTSDAHLNFDVYRHRELPLHVISVGGLVENKLSKVYVVNILYDIRNSFDVVLVDTDSLYGEDKRVLFDVSTSLYIVTDFRSDVRAGTEDFISRYVKRDYNIIENKKGIKDERDNLFSNSMEIGEGNDRVREVLAGELNKKTRKKQGVYFSLW